METNNEPASAWVFGIYCICVKSLIKTSIISYLLGLDTSNFVSSKGSSQTECMRRRVWALDDQIFNMCQKYP